MGFPYLLNFLSGDKCVFGYRKPVVNRLFLIYCLIGGMYFESRISRTVRCFWFALNSAYICVLISSNIYFIVAGNSELGIFLLLMLGNGMGSFGTVGFPLITYYFRNHILSVLTMIDNDFDNDDDKTLLNCGSSQSYTTVWVITLVTLLNAAVYVCFGLVDMAIDYDPALLQDPYHHLLYFPLIPYCTSLFMFIIIFSTEIFLILPCIPFPILYPVCILFIAMEIRRSFFVVCDQLTDICKGNIVLKVSSHQFENYRSLGLENDRQYWNDEDCEKYIDRLKKCIQQYQKLIRIFEDIKPWMEICVSITVMPYFVCQIVPVYVILMFDYTSLVKVRLLMALILGNTFLYAGCVVGEIIAGINERVITEVYSLPWIHLPPKHRQIFQIIQCQMQHPIQLCVFRRWPAKMMLFPAVVKLTYTYINAFYHLHA